jgi:hypothetical protein
VVSEGGVDMLERWLEGGEEEAEEAEDGGGRTGVCKDEDSGEPKGHEDA